MYLLLGASKILATPRIGLEFTRSRDLIARQKRAHDPHNNLMYIHITHQLTHVIPSPHARKHPRFQQRAHIPEYHLAVTASHSHNLKTIGEVDGSSCPRTLVQLLLLARTEPLLHLSG